MADILNTAVTGLLAFQRSLATTSHNVANVNTEGFSRQRVDLATLPAQQSDPGFIGQGVQVAGVHRILDQFLVDALRGNLAEQERLAILTGLANSVDALLADPDAGMAGALQNFSAGVQVVADDPASSGARQVLLAEMRALEDRFTTLDQRLATLDGQVAARLDGAAAEINALAGSVAELNAAIFEASGSAAGAPPNDLLDKRDLAIDRLAEQIGLTTITQADGSLNVFIASGQPLVLGDRANTVEIVNGEFGRELPDVALTGSLGGGVITRGVSGGVLGGLLDFRREMLEPAHNTLGQLATVLAGTFNAQHRDGMTAAGTLGGDVFAVSTPQTVASALNGGAGSVVAGVVDLSLLSPADYVLSFDGAAYTLTRQDTGAVVPMSGAGTAADPFLADGLSLVASGGSVAGDRFLIRATHQAAGSFARLISDPDQIAAAAPIRSSLDPANIGDARISAGEVLDVSDPNLLSIVTIEFTSATTYSINGAGSFAYVSGDPIDVNGWRVQISGAPLTGDRFVVESNAGGTGDNRNALLLAGVLDQNVLNGGQESIAGGYAALVATIGVTTRANQINLAAQSVVTAQARADRESVSGVNLEEEAANLLRFQQAYQAAAQLIGVADVLFQTLLASVRR